MIVFDGFEDFSKMSAEHTVSMRSSATDSISPTVPIVGLAPSVGLNRPIPFTEKVQCVCNCRFFQRQLHPKLRAF
jgi:hypothetical protein